MEDPHEETTHRSSTTRRQTFCNFSISVFFALLQISVAAVAEEQKCLSSCGNIPLKHPFGPGEGCGAFPYNQLLSCEGGTQLRLRTSSGPFDVQHVDYDKKTMTITDTSKSTCSPLSGSVFAPDAVLQPVSRNIMILFDCPESLSESVCSQIASVDCNALRSRCGGLNSGGNRSCCASDFARLGKGGLRATGCGRYASLFGLDGGGWGYGLRVSFDLPEQVPLRLCAECERPDGNCGVALRCICFPRSCKNEVVSSATHATASTVALMTSAILWLTFTGFGL
eukprot:TRINITY_DN3402_c0_g1_i1.p1 TRINITY_DN3402_c0_g1~~TRINITY_DN3402_c0_g1_i1.p1  ORF type:complete len:282 (-),score=21.12 TRINITY_DN3402_c0_g1_i1:443-1288(-)